MAVHARSILAPARPLLPFAFRPSPPPAARRTADDLLSAIAAEIERQVDGEPRPELPPEPLLPLPAPLLSLTAAFSRRRAIFGTVTLDEPDTAAEARTIHLRRGLELAAEHGADLLAALGLPQLAALDSAIASLDVVEVIS